MTELAGRTALVTGGGRGIGRHIATGLAEAGADVIVASRKLANCQATSAALEALGRRAWAFPVDLADAASIDALADAALGAVDRLDILVKQRGRDLGRAHARLRSDGRLGPHVRRERTRALAALAARRAAHGRSRRRRDRARVVDLRLPRVARGEGPAIAYNAGRGAVNTLTKDMAVKLARDRIRVNSIAPGAFDTDMMDYVRGDAEKMARFLDQIPLARAGGEDDVKGAAVFLASDAAAYVTGHNLIVDGGWLVRA